MTDEDTKERTELGALWIGLLASPVSWALQMEANYLLVPWACQRGHYWPLYLVSVVALVIALSGGLLAWRAWQRVGREGTDEAESALSWTRFMALLGVLTTAMFSLVIIVQGIPSFMFHACQL